MFLLHRIGRRVNSNFNTIEEILTSDGPISFDGIYDSVLWHADELVGKDVTLFVMGDHIGGDNHFDVGQPPAKYLDWHELQYLVTRLNAKLAWHTWSHRDLTKLSDADVIREITPHEFIPTVSLAYPYGRVDERVAKLVEQAGYQEAWAAGPYGDGSQFQKKRPYLGW
jgi:peptidoglycan/xylan/chitin deacetylase (PgdA/CDA1 family)